MLRIGIIGCGGMGRHHTGALQRLEGVGISAVADVNAEAAASLKEMAGAAHCFTDYQDLLKLQELDAVFICLPTGLHRDAVTAAAAARKHIFCEKPIAMKLEDAQAMIDACREAGVVFMIGFVRRFDNDWGKIRELIQSDAIGRPVVWRHCTAGAGPGALWYVDKDMGGGPLIDGAVHNYDFARYTFGEAKRAAGSMKHFRTDATGWDTGTGIVNFESGDDLMLSWSWGLPRGSAGGGLFDFMGPKGALTGPVPAEELPEGVGPATHGAYRLTLAEGEQRIEVFEKNNMFHDEVDHFVECLRGGADCRVTGEDGKRALEIGLAILESSKIGETMVLGTS